MKVGNPRALLLLLIPAAIGLGGWLWIRHAAEADRESQRRSAGDTAVTGGNAAGIVSAADGGARR